MNLRDIKRAATNRLNYDWLALAVGIIGVLQVADLSFLSERIRGGILIALALLNVSVAWYRAQVGIGGQRQLK